MNYTSGSISNQVSSYMVENISAFGTDIFGTPLGNYILAMVFVLLTALLAKSIYYVFKTHIRKITSKTKTDLDEIIVDMIEEPVVIFIVIFGLWLSIFLFINLNNNDMGLVSSIRDVLIVLNLIWLLTRLFDKLFDKIVVPYTKSTKSKLDEQLTPIVKDGVKVILFGVGILFLIQNAGYDVTAILGGLGIAGLAVAMAAQTSLSDVIGGAIIFANQPFEIGDYIKFGGDSGTVNEINLRYCRLTTLEGTQLIVPNSLISKTVIENYSRSMKRRVDTKIGVVYETPHKKLELAKKLMEKIIEETEGVEDPTIYLEEFGDSAIVFRYRYYVKDVSKRLKLIDQVNFNLKREFEKNKIEFAYPTSVVYLRK
ncbi:mechanosensitive ion channel family protein [Candidatus Micrarchaeota archaeon]|nr:mechanosensitive ion channel family protein [Candidatus Micrarchaeota archaeon]